MDESEAIEISSTEDVEFQDESSASEVIVPKRTTNKEVYIVDSDEYREESSESESEVVTKGNSKKRTKSSGSMSTDDYFEVSESSSESEGAQGDNKKKLKKRSNASSRSSDFYFRSSTNSSSESESSDSSASIQSESESEVGNVGRRQNRTARGRKSDKSDEYLEDSSEESSSESSSAVRARSKKRPAPKNNRTGKRAPPAKKAKGAAANGRNTAAAVAAAKKGFPSGQQIQSDNFQRVSLAECQRADAERFIHLSKHRKLFESFVTPSVMEQLTAPVASGRSSDQHHLHHQVLSQPEAVVNVQMRDYQVEGMSWLVSNYLRSISCILGDEMGLGKTLQSIAFVAHMVFVRKVSGPFLFIVPLSVLFNWYNEFRRFCPSLSVLRFYSQDKDEQARLRTVLLDSARNDVVLATYDTVKKGGLANAGRCKVSSVAFSPELRCKTT